MLRVFVLIAGLWLFAASAMRAADLPFALTEAREPCESHDKLRRPFFGDLHVHTVLSLDASTQGTRNRPADAYRFARGARLDMQPYDEAGVGRRSLQILRPLDFAAVTDHAELLGETHICNTPGLPGHDSFVCGIYRRWPRLAYYVMSYRANIGSAEDPPRRFGFCGENGEICQQASRAPWQEIRDTAEMAYDRSGACRFTSFVAYEWTGAAGAGNNMHRNVIFRNHVVPELPLSFIEAPHPEQLWAGLKEDCEEAPGGCEAIVIPHNPNLGGGKMFSTEALAGGPIGAEEASARARFEVLAEVMQHKGESECHTGLGNEDELCGFEKLPMHNFRGRSIPFLIEPPTANQFLRNTLEEGLVQQARIGVNPFKFGLMASTDTHLAAPGAVLEDASYLGHGGAGTPARDSIPKGLPDAAYFNPGGLAVAWAEENSRDSIFAALRRRETYGTSGPRPVVRFFGGWQYPRGLCDRPDLVEVGYRLGVPMGADLAAPTRKQAQAGPRFVLAALRDPGVPGHPGTQLQRTQIIKGWLGDDGRAHEKVYEVAGDPQNGAGVDPSSCRPKGPGADSLCAVWSDPDFDAKQAAFYYARVIENPTCRWTTWICHAGGVDCSNPDTIGEGFEACCDGSQPETLQERAWTSPIWYTPVAAP